MFSYLFASSLTGFNRFFLRGSSRQRKLVLRMLDVLLCGLSIYFAIATRFETLSPSMFVKRNAGQIFLLILIQYFVFNFSGLYRSTIRYSSVRLVQDVARAVMLSTLILIALTYFWGGWALARSILIINALFTLTLVVFARLSLRQLIRRAVRRHSGEMSESCETYRLLIYGAGEAGTGLMHSLWGDPRYEVVGFVDDNQSLQGQFTEGIRVYAPKRFLASKRHEFDQVVLAMPSASRMLRRQIVEDLKRQGLSVKTVPSLGGIISGKVAISDIQDVDIVDLLGRDEVSPDPELLQKQTTRKAVLVTGAGGSIGSELCRQIIQQGPDCLVLYELNEFALYSIHQELKEAYPESGLMPCLGNVTDGEHLSLVLEQYGIETLYHAAAYKHVPLLESNVAKAVENNVYGTLTVAQCALQAGVKQFVLISTDKAVRPTNVMGATKRIAELTVQALAAEPESPTKFAIVRFGNVLGSSGSVVPRFRKQIAAGGPITLTHRDITRYFMSIPEAARLVIQAGALSEGGEVFLLDMGEPVNIYDLATQMITLSGLKPREDISIEIVGLRPGEKLYEELLISGDDVRPTSHSKIYGSEEYFYPWEKLEPRLNQLIDCSQSNNIGLAKAALRVLVPEYKPKVDASNPGKSLEKEMLPSLKALSMPSN